MDPNTEKYELKEVQFFDKSVIIAMQSKYGPCPLLALLNTLILRGEVVIAKSLGGGNFFIKHRKVLEILGNLLSKKLEELKVSGKDEVARQHIEDSLKALPSFLNGMDINIRFRNVTDVEFTAESSIFDLFGIEILHGWLIDEEDVETLSVVGDMSYNTINELLIRYGDDNTEIDLDGGPWAGQDLLEVLARCMNFLSTIFQYSDFVLAISMHLVNVLKEFMDRNAGQCTYYGLRKLHEYTHSNHSYVLFKANHFSTIFKHKDELYTLVTSEAHKGYKNIVWQKLANEDQSIFCDSNFRPSHFPTGVSAGYATEFGHKPDIPNYPRATDAPKARNTTTTTLTQNTADKRGEISSLPPNDEFWVDSNDMKQIEEDKRMAENIHRKEVKAMEKRRKKAEEEYRRRNHDA